MLSSYRTASVLVAAFSVLVTGAGEAEAHHRESTAADIVVPLVASTLLATHGAETRYASHRDYRYRYRDRYRYRGYRSRPHYYHGYRYGRDRYGRRYRTYWYHDGYRYRPYRRYY